MKTLVLDNRSNKIGYVASESVKSIKGIKSRGINLNGSEVEPYIQLGNNGFFVITVYGV